MPNKPESVQPAGGSSPANAPEALAGQALARRQMLLRGLSKGGTVVAAFVPIKTLAQSSSTILVTTDNTLCTQSGQQSNVLSRTLPKVTCTGYKPAHYVKSPTAPYQANDWPAGWNASSAMFRNIFTSSTDNTKLLTYLGAQPTSLQAHWIAAYFNATKGATLNFPYTPAEVIDQYNADAAANVILYKTFLSGLA